MKSHSVIAVVGRVLLRGKKVVFFNSFASNCGLRAALSPCSLFHLSNVLLNRRSAAGSISWWWRENLTSINCLWSHNLDTHLLHAGPLDEHNDIKSFNISSRIPEPVPCLQQPKGRYVNYLVSDTLPFFFLFYPHANVLCVISHCAECFGSNTREKSAPAAWSQARFPRYFHFHSCATMTFSTTADYL